MTEPAVGFPDAEELCVTYVAAELASRSDGAVVATETRKDDPPRRVRITRTGGPRRDIVTDEPQMTFQCWDDDSVSASELARLVRALVWALPGREPHGHLVRDVTELGGPVSFPDPTTEYPRYQFTVVLNVRGEEI